MNRQERMLYSALGVLAGSLFLVLGIDLHNRYSYTQSYETAFHFHLPGLAVMITGGVLIVLGLVGVVFALLQRD